ncbi:hypothetical protein K438DRAFT_1993182 [Mycena galopus ATCC 62051]|nr:hypothetical protein K438DRAFT_1993182 [Mycena galopus ATCC 62051]
MSVRPFEHDVPVYFEPACLYLYTRLLPPLYYARSPHFPCAPCTLYASPELPTPTCPTLQIFPRPPTPPVRPLLQSDAHVPRLWNPAPHTSDAHTVYFECTSALEAAPASSMHAAALLPRKIPSSHFERPHNTSPCIPSARLHTSASPMPRILAHPSQTPLRTHTPIAPMEPQHPRSLRADPHRAPALVVYAKSHCARTSIAVEPATSAITSIHFVTR